MNGSNDKRLSVAVIGNSYAVKSGLEKSSEVGIGRNQVVKKIKSSEKSEAVYLAAIRVVVYTRVLGTFCLG